ncbi:unnamed protein product, partial [Heterotrigona itama]
KQVIVLLMENFFLYLENRVFYSRSKQHNDYHRRWWDGLIKLHGEVVGVHQRYKRTFKPKKSVKPVESSATTCSSH